MKKRPTALESLLLRIDHEAPGSCWQWSGSEHVGYGRLWANGRHWKAHRLSYTLFIGPLPTNHEVHHTCRNRSCVNPAHFQALTHREHMRERRKAYCLHGHSMAIHARSTPSGRRYCSRCQVVRCTERRRRLRDLNAQGIAKALGGAA